MQYIQPNSQQNNTRRITRKNIWLNSPFSSNIKSNLKKIFLQLIDTYFPLSNKLHKTFNRKTVKFSYICTKTISQIIKGHDEKATQIKQHHQLQCNCRIKTKCSFSGERRKEDVIYKWIALTNSSLKKCILDLQRDIITTSNHFKTGNAPTYNSLQLCLEKTKNEKINTNCCTIQKHNDVLYVSTRS